MEGYQKNDRTVIKRGDIFYANLSPVVGSEQGGSRPVLILQNNIGNKYSPTIIVAAITAQITKGKLPTHIELKADKCKLERDSVVLLEQLRTIDKKRLRNKITTLDNNIMKSVDEAVKVSMGLVQF
ncbi:type II toxin-antitoxin system PemK/MazF family toxin [Pectinatus cerevisiiphilus]|uniref:mRNA interferase n=1 Tax=Pectinatus cerevisiiphilus TaxID=86956 RepID=A0A4R3KCS0_9FIRM|nr:type II toxin-antitoxin system PemK/MazF family toxin [Pectinatus cerevisiiphilus]TCS80885.1 mRNA interferase MazF [Pectinatus cerevisiiphilus]